ncbi:hypothetical protein ACIQJ4_22460 [Streptomyces filamentosus]|uniref:hypothetical protein n=1 Tax=Streptomyces filamentosus TaxID=67294 RepID=UPI00380AA580
MTHVSVDSFGHERHPWIGRTVRDIASRGEGELTAVVQEETRGRIVRVAFIKAENNIEWSTAVGNVQLVP